ncbi:MAG: XdhC family protein [Caldilineaceae bacterium]|nr:XdhC family protein [Caldilineaceae bacterium]
MTIYHSLQKQLDQDLTVALATIVRVRGSTPREVGAQMIIHPLGKHIGTVGGGCGEADVIRAGLDVIGDGRARIVRIDLTEGISMESLGVCGGTLDVLIERRQPHDPEQRALLDALVQAIDARQSVAVVTGLPGWNEADGPPISRALFTEAGAGIQSTLDPALNSSVAQAASQALARRAHAQIDVAHAAGVEQFFIQTLAQPAHLIIVGAGHIAVPLAEIAHIADFQVTVLDDRPLYANRERFPQAERVIAGPFQEELIRLRGARAAFDAHTYVVLVTRGHQHDVACLLEILDDPVAYIGMIGSRRRIRAVFDLLEKGQGIPAEKFARIHAPVGLSINAQTPAEIAVAIMAEIIAVKRRG